MCWQRHEQFHWSEQAGRSDRPPRHDGDLRVSDADRQAVIDELRQHTGDGRLTLEEFEERVDEVLRARTWAELDTATRELPSLQPTTPPRRSGSRLPLRPGVIAACLVVVLLMAGHWWVLFPVGFFIFGRGRRYAHHSPRHRLDERDDSVAPV
jgi:hypothetical protein